MRPPLLSSIAAGIVAATLLVAPQGPAMADAATAPGDLFPGFVRLQGDQGPSVPGSGQVTAVGVQSTGKIVFAQHGEATTLRRLHADGTPDPSWGDGGSITVGSEWVHDLVVLPDDRIAIADADVRRFTADGWPDHTFSGDGVAPIVEDPGYTASYAQDLILEPDGDLLVAGDAFYETSDWDVFAMRFRPDGSVDPGFRGIRHSYCDIDCLENNLTVGALSDPGGSYHLVGMSRTGAEMVQPRSWRLTPGTTYDPPPSPLPLPSGAVKALIRGQANDTGFLSGYAAEGTYLAKLRVTADGVVLDPTWGVDGVQHLTYAEEVMAGAVQPDGKLVVATYRGLMRRNPDGSIDESFRSSPSEPTGDGTAYAVALTPDGGVLRAGTEAAAPAATSTPFVHKFVGELAHASTAVAHTPVAGLAQTATITYRNSGPDAAEGSRVSIRTTGGLVAALTQSQGSCAGDGGTWTCSLGKVAAGVQATVQVTLTSASATTGTLTATGSSTTYDAHPADQSSSTTITTTAPPAIAPPPTTTPPATASMTLVTSPVVKGRARVGNKLKATTGTWTPTPSGYRYRWLRNGRAITKATRRTYVLTRKDLGKRIAVRVTASRSGHTPSTATSRAVRVEDRDRSATRSRPVLRSLSS